VWCQNGGFVAVAEVPQWCVNMRRSWNEAADDPNGIVLAMRLAQQLVKHFDHYLGAVLTTVNPALCAAALHPHHGHLDFVSEDVRRQVRAYLREELRELELHEPVVAASSGDTETELFFAPERQLLDLEEMFARFTARKEALKKVKAMEWWRGSAAAMQPAIAKLARCYFSIPAASAPTERAFSLAGFEKSNRRTCLNDSRLEQLVVVADYMRSTAVPRMRATNAPERAFQEMMEACIAGMPEPEEIRTSLDTQTHGANAVGVVELA
jgi:hypothetical protein